MKPNLSDKEFFNLYVKNKDWYPLQNHGLVDNEIKLQEDDKDFPNQITTYLNLFKNIQINKHSILDLGCGWGRGTHVIKKYFKESFAVSLKRFTQISFPTWNKPLML